MCVGPELVETSSESERSRKLTNWLSWLLSSFSLPISSLSVLSFLVPQRIQRKTALLVLWMSSVHAVCQDGGIHSLID